MGAFILSLILGGAISTMENIKASAQVATAEADLKSLGASLEMYRVLGGVYPSTDQGLKSLVKKPTTVPRAPRWTQVFKKLPVDPWGRAYQYKLEKGKIKLWSKGPDPKDKADDLLYVPPKKEDKD